MKKLLLLSILFIFSFNCYSQTFFETVKDTCINVDTIKMPIILWAYDLYEYNTESTLLNYDAVNYKVLIESDIITIQGKEIYRLENGKQYIEDDIYHVEFLAIDYLGEKCYIGLKKYEHQIDIMVAYEKHYFLLKTIIK
jgi:hypothetical protein